MNDRVFLCIEQYKNLVYYLNMKNKENILRVIYYGDKKKVQINRRV